MQKFNAQYRSVPLSVPCVFSKFEVRERLGLKTGGARTAFPCVLGHFNHWLYIYEAVDFNIGVTGR